MQSKTWAYGGKSRKDCWTVPPQIMQHKAKAGASLPAGLKVSLSLRLTAGNRPGKTQKPPAVSAQTASLDKGHDQRPKSSAAKLVPQARNGPAITQAQTKTGACTMTNATNQTRESDKTRPLYAYIKPPKGDLRAIPVAKGGV